MTDIKTENATYVEGLELSGEDAVFSTSQRAAEYEAREHSLTRAQAIKENWKPILWCLYMFFICCMWGFDGLAGGVVVSINAFREDFGTLYEGQYVVDANWQLGFQAATLFGLVFGGFVTGIFVNKFGRQPCLLVAFLLTVAGVGVQVFSKDNAMFFGGKMLTGVPLGCYTTVAPTYGSEMAPLKIRGALTAGMNFAIVLGQMLGYVVMRQASYYEGSLQYKVLFATQWGFVAVGLVILPFFPESPYWLIAHNREDKARKNVIKLHGPNYDVEGHLAQIHDSLARINQGNQSQGTMLECFGKKQWKRTLVGTSMYAIQNCCGTAWVVGYMSYFMELGGLPASSALSMSVGICGFMVVGNMCGWVFVEWFGRRGTALWGVFSLTIILFLIGGMACINSNSGIWAQAAFMAVWSFVYQGTIGSAAWPITAENATSRLRAPTQSLATVANGLSACIWSFALPYAINPDQGNLGGKIAFVFGGVLVFATIFIYYLVPETKGRTYIEIDELWARGIPPRHFGKTTLIAVGGSEVDAAADKNIAE